MNTKLLTPREEFPDVDPEKIYWAIIYHSYMNATAETAKQVSKMPLGELVLEGWHYKTAEETDNVIEKIKKEQKNPKEFFTKEIQDICKRSHEDLEKNNG